MDVRRLLFLLLLGFVPLQAATSFISPQQGGQAVGPMPVEVTTDVANVDRVEFFVDGALAGVARKAPWRIAYDFGTKLEGRTIAAKVWSDGFRHMEQTQIVTAALTAGESISVDVVEVPLRVRTSRTLRADDFRVRENDVEQTVREVKAERPPAHFAFVIDRSLSMGDGRLEAALRAVDAALGQLRGGDTASVILFNHNVAQGRTIARGERVSRLFAGIVPSGGTSLRDALASIPATQRTYAIAITDGGDRNSQLDEETALRRISGTRTVVGAIVLGNASRFLERAAKNTGGTLAHASAETIGSELRDLLADINSRYTLVYQSHGTPRGWRSIAVTPRVRGLTVASARKGYFAE